MKSYRVFDMYNDKMIDVEAENYISAANKAHANAMGIQATLDCERLTTNIAHYVGNAPHVFAVQVPYDLVAEFANLPESI